MKYQGKSMMSLNEMARLAIDYEGDGYVTGYPIVSGDDTYILNGVIEANEEYITINQWVPVFPESLKPVSPPLNDNHQIVINFEMSDGCAEVSGWEYPKELNIENLRFLFNDVLENESIFEFEEGEE